MGTNNLNDRSSGETIVQAFFNDIHTAMNADFVGRNSSGVPTSGQSLGTAAFPWGTARFNGLVIGGSTVDVSQVSAPAFRVVSGATRAGSNQPAFLDPAGAAGGASVTVLATTTNLVADINGATATLTADIVKSGLTLAPAANNTALVNDTVAADQEDTRLWGEIDHNKPITMDTVGTSISGLLATWQAFKINDGATDEAFFAKIESVTSLEKAFRGYFQDAAQAPVNRIKFFNNDTITLLTANYLFLDSDLATVDATTTVPVWDFSAPGSPVTGDYWFDLGNTLWKRYDGATFQTVNRVFIGIAVCDDTDCLYARPVDFDARYSSANNMVLEKQSTEIIRARNIYSKISVAGIELFYQKTAPLWNITTDLAGSADMYNATEQASTRYYCYVKDDGDTVISDISPYLRIDLFGYYHPHNPWRYMGESFNDSGSALQGAGSEAEALIVRYETNAGQSIGTGVAIRLQYEDELDDNYKSVIDPAVTWEFIVPFEGIYTLHAQAFSIASAVVSRREIQILLNGITHRINRGYVQSGSVEQGAEITEIFTLKKGDTIEIFYFQNTGGALAIFSDRLVNFVTISGVRTPVSR